MGMSTINLPAGAAKQLSVFVFYTDFPAGVHAKLVADGLARQAGATVEPLLDIWKLDSIPPVGSAQAGDHPGGAAGRCLDSGLWFTLRPGRVDHAMDELPDSPEWNRQSAGVARRPV